jgi:hypothetical protein
MPRRINNLQTYGQLPASQPPTGLEDLGVLCLGETLGLGKERNAHLADAPRQTAICELFTVGSLA